MTSSSNSRLLTELFLLRPLRQKVETRNWLVGKQESRTQQQAPQKREPLQFSVKHLVSPSCAQSKRTLKTLGVERQFSQRFENPLAVPLAR